MKVAGISVEAIEVPFDKPFQGSSYAVISRRALIARVTLDDGTVTVCHSGNGHEDAPLVARMATEIGQLMVGKSLHSVEQNWAELFDVAGPVQSQWRQRNLTHAIATVDTALWHALGVTTDQPLCRLLGSDPNPIPAMFIGGYYGEGTPEEDVESAIAFVKSSGVAAVKLKVGDRDADSDIRRLRLTRELGGDDLQIVCDANGGWDLPTARRFADAAVDYDIEWLEEPVHWHSDVDGMRIMRANGKVQIGAGQSETSPQRAAKLVKDGVVDVINFDASWGGGITGWRKVAGIAELSGVRVAHHSEPQVGMHLLAGIRHRGYVEVYEPERYPVWYEMIDTPPVIDGAVTAPYEPGIGLVIDESFVERYRVS